jgi:hypothetical protein
MDHANHAPETRRRSGTHTPDGHVAANFQYIRVKQSDVQSASLDSTVPLDFTTGVMTQLRVYRETADQQVPSIDYQVVPGGPALAPRIPDRSPEDDPLYLKTSYIGKITVNVPGGDPRTFQITTRPGNAVPLDLTKGLNVTCSFDWASVLSQPIGPMLNVDISPGP